MSGSGSVRVLVDMDGVLADFEGALLRKYRERYPREAFIELSERRGFLARDQYRQISPELGPKLSSVYESPGFFLDLKPIPGAIEAMKEMSNLRNTEVFLCTSPILQYEHCVQEKLFVSMLLDPCTFVPVHTVNQTACEGWVFISSSSSNYQHAYGNKALSSHRLKYLPSAILLESAVGIQGLHAPVKGESAVGIQGLHDSIKGESAEGIQGLHAPVKGESAEGIQGLHAPVKGESAEGIQGLHAPVKGESAEGIQGLHAPVKAVDFPCLFEAAVTVHTDGLSCVDSAGVQASPSWEHILFTCCHNQHLQLQPPQRRLQSWADDWRAILDSKRRPN
ncbi:UNVERIFIED_CONTAM: hypothetical protein FKN15_052797 [Acipenser sinensis]